MAPEIRRSDPYDAHKADMFSFGVLMYTLRAREYPWKEAVYKDDKFRQHYLGSPNDFWQAVTPRYNPNYFDSDFKDLLNQLWKRDLSERLTVEETMLHPWITREVETFDQTNFVAEMQSRYELILAEMQ